MRWALFPLLVACSTAPMEMGCTKGTTANVSEGCLDSVGVLGTGLGLPVSQSDAIRPAPDSNASSSEPRGPARCSRLERQPKRPLEATPQILWSADIYSLGVKSQVATAAGQVAVSTGATLSIYDQRGGQKGTWRNPSNAQISAPTAGPDGHFYVAADVAVRVDASGKERWTIPLRRNHAFHAAAPHPLLLSPEGNLYSLQPDGALQALRATDGQPLWRKSIGGTKGSQSRRLVGGVGANLVVNGDAEHGFMVLDSKNGDVLWEGTRPDTKNGAGLTAISVLPGWGVLVGDQSDSYLRIGVWGWSGERQWSLDVPRGVVFGFQLVDHSGHLVFLEAALPRGAGKSERLVRLSCDGTRRDEVAIDPGPNAYFGAFALGADGLTYGLTFPSDNTTGGVRLVIFDSSYRPVRTLEFKDQGVPSYGGVALVISDDGILYLALQAKDFTGKLHAVQTTSPGLAATPRSTLRLEATGSNWAAH